MDIEKYDIFNRVGLVVLTINKQEYAFKDLNFRFNVSMIMDKFPRGEITVDILGLSQETMNKIVAMSNKVDNLSRGSKVTVYAGYKGQEDESKSYRYGEYFGDLLFSADIVYATITSAPPEMWLRITGVMWYRYQFMRANINVPSQVKKDENDENPQDVPVTYQRIFDAVLQAMNSKSDESGITVRLDWRAELTKLSDTVGDGKESFVSSGSIYSVLSQISDLGKLYVFQETSENDVNQMTIYVVDRMDASGADGSTPDGANEQLMRMVRQMNSSKMTLRKKKLTKDSGLIGIPSLQECTSLKSRMLLDPRMKAGDFMWVHTDILPCLNSEGTEETWKEKANWIVLEVTHHGELRGQEWYTEITAIDPLRLANLNNAKKHESTYTEVK